MTAPTLEQRIARGEQARREVAPASHAGWEPDPQRPDPVDLLQEQNLARDADLVPVRHGRMMATPFTFYRGAAKIMAVDLGSTPTAGLEVQLCGDAHLSNFGVFASPERRLLFDINDFDETLPGPFEYDVKRLAASFAVAAINNGYDEAQHGTAAQAAVAAYRGAMAEFAGMRTLDVWYAHLADRDLKDAVRRAREQRGTKAERKAAKKEGERAFKTLEKARSRDHLQALSKLAEVVDGRYRIASLPPTLVPSRDLPVAYDMTPDEVLHVVERQFEAYRESLPEDRRHLLERFELVDFARKVVGVGSVGTRAFVALLQGRDDQDPLFLQVKEATSSVLEGHLPPSRFEQPGERVVQGQRLMQAASDLFLGWSTRTDGDRFFYWRQLRDMKGSAVVERMSPDGLVFYAGLCGWTLARAHARSGDPVSIAAYLGPDDAFDLAVVDFSLRYAAQNERDHATFHEAVRSSRIPATENA